MALTHTERGSDITGEVWAIVGVGVALGAAIIPSLHSIRNEIGNMHREIGNIHREIGGLHERMARLEGLFEGFTGRSAETPESGAT